MTISQALADNVLSLSLDKMPGDSVSAAKTHFIDGLACMFFGMSSRSVKLTLAYDRDSGASGRCLFPNAEGYRTSVESCAMLGAISAHSNDYDDMSTALNGHPSALLVPVVFSLAQKYPCTGRDMLLAYIAGVETDAIIGKIFAAGGYYKGWNTTCFLGVIGAAAAAGRLIGLDRDQMVSAIGIAVNEASGFKANFGTPAKDLAIGSAARKAIMAAECAKHGMTASADVFEGPFGLLKSFGINDMELARGIIGAHTSDFLDPGLVMKPYPSCRGNHSGIDAASDLVARYGITAENVKRVLCYVDQAAYDTDRYAHPETPDQAKFSLAFCIGKVITGSKVTLQDFIGDEIADKAALSFIDKVQIECRPELFPESRFGTEVHIELADGRILSEKACFAKGDPNKPMTDQEIEEKLRSCLAEALGEDRADAAAKKLKNFDEVSDVEELLAVLV